MTATLPDPLRQLLYDRILEQTRVLISDNERLLARGRRLIARRHGFSGSSDALNVKRLVIERLNKGNLPAAPARIWAGHGTGRICIVCDQMITPTQL